MTDVNTDPAGVTARQRAAVPDGAALPGETPKPGQPAASPPAYQVAADEDQPSDYDRLTAEEKTAYDAAQQQKTEAQLAVDRANEKSA